MSRFFGYVAIVYSFVALAYAFYNQVMELANQFFPQQQYVGGELVRAY